MKRLVYRLSNIIQGLFWVIGLSIHNHIGGECCPDFSCCSPVHKRAFGWRLRYLIKTWVIGPLRPVYFRLFHPSVAQTRLCSGYRFFPDGTDCPGCLDCHTIAKETTP